MSGMYRDESNFFTREQLVFVVEAALAGAFDKVEGALPTGSRVVGGADLKRWKQDEENLRQFVFGAVYQVGIFIPILWAQTEGQRVGDGMGTNEFVGWEDFESMVEEYIAYHLVEGNEVKSTPNCRALAEKIVDDAWKDYFAHAAKEQYNV